MVSVNQEFRQAYSGESLFLLHCVWSCSWKTSGLAVAGVGEGRVLESSKG